MLNVQGASFRIFSTEDRTNVRSTSSAPACARRGGDVTEGDACDARDVDDVGIVGDACDGHRFASRSAVAPEATRALEGGRSARLTLSRRRRPNREHRRDAPLVRTRVGV